MAHLSPEFLLIFLSNLYITPFLGKIFKLMVLRLLKTKLVSQKIKSRQFVMIPMQNSLPYPYHHLPGRGKILIPPW